MRRRPLLSAAALAASALFLTACAAAGPDPAAAPQSGAAKEAASSGYPLELDNCGHTVTVSETPRRIVTVKSSTTELVLALGLGERIVGSAFLDGPLPESLKDEGSSLNIISDFLPGPEAVLALQPDFVYGGWESNFVADGVGERETLADLGIASYVSPAACKAEGYRPDPLTFDTVFAEITEAGAIFGEKGAAADLVSRLSAELDALAPTEGAPTALWYSSGTDTPYVGAGIGSPQMIMDAAGLTNIFADVHDTWTSAGWESIVAADPDVIVLVDASWNTAASKIELLESNPATRDLTAVTEKRYATLPFAATEAGIRNVEAAGSLVDQVARYDGQ
jgi:iron complex transport system substrate-binding protein